ncbi:hypothetical protein QMP26_41460 (plasmid) [Enterocloster clostridioformis]
MEPDIELLEKMGIHVVTKDERDSVLAAANEHLEMMQRLKAEFQDNPPTEGVYKITVRISDLELREFKKKIMDSFQCSSITPQELIKNLIGNLAGYRSNGSDERMLARQWLESVEPTKNEICSLFDKETIHDVKYSIALLDWEYKRISEISEKAGMSLNQLIESFIRDVAGYRPQGSNYGHSALNYLKRVSINY